MPQPVTPRDMAECQLELMNIAAVRVSPEAAAAIAQAHATIYVGDQIANLLAAIENLSDRPTLT